jgi:hypothetical protein
VLDRRTLFCRMRCSGRVAVGGRSVRLRRSQ